MRGSEPARSEEGVTMAVEAGTTTEEGARGCPLDAAPELREYLDLGGGGRRLLEN